MIFYISANVALGSNEPAGRQCHMEITSVGIDETNAVTAALNICMKVLRLCVSPIDPIAQAEALFPIESICGNITYMTESSITE